MTVGKRITGKLKVGGNVIFRLDEIEVLKEKLATIEAKIQQIDLNGANSQIIADFLQNFVERFNKLEVGEKKLLIQSILKRIDVHNKNKIHLELTLPIPSENEKCESASPCNQEDTAFASSFKLSANETVLRPAAAPTRPLAG